MDRIGIPVAQTSRPDALLLAVDSGKGATEEQALASALMEGFERCVGERFSPPVISTDSSNPKCVTAFPRIQGSGANRTQEWTTAVGIKSGAEWFVPLNAAILRPAINPFEVYCCWSNGLSSGNTLEEAIVGGLYEVIERDAINAALRKSNGTLVDVYTIPDPVVRDIVAKIDEAGCRFLVLDATCDTRVPVFHAYLYDFDDPSSVIAYGSGAHLNPAIAVARAMCESVQARTVWMTGTRDDIGHERFSMARGEDAEADYDRLASICEWRDFNAKDTSTNSFSEDIQTLINHLAEAGIPEPLLINMDGSHDFPCSVVKVLAPGLAGYFSKACRPGRPT
jgi:ribosomal protein S12 methylthiotransferase accessory factor